MQRMFRTLTLRALTLFVVCGGLLSCGGPQTTETRMAQAESGGVRAERLLDEADRQMKALEPDRAEDLLSEVRTILKDPTLAAYPEHQMLRDQLTKAESRMVSVREEVRRRDLARAVAARTQALSLRVAALEKALIELRGPAAGAEQIEAVEDSDEKVRDAIEEGKDLEAKDPAYGAVAQAAEQTRDRFVREAKQIEKMIAFRTGPLVARLSAHELGRSAKAEKDEEKREELYAEWLERLVDCRESSERWLATSPELAKAHLVVAGAKTSPGTVAKSCASEAIVVNKRVEALTKAKEKKAAKKTAPKATTKKKKRSK